MIEGYPRWCELNVQGWDSQWRDVLYYAIKNHRYFELETIEGMMRIGTKIIKLAKRGTQVSIKNMFLEEWRLWTLVFSQIADKWDRVMVQKYQQLSGEEQAEEWAIAKFSNEIEPDDISPSDALAAAITLARYIKRSRETSS